MNEAQAMERLAAVLAAQLGRPINGRSPDVFSSVKMLRMVRELVLEETGQWGAKPWRLLTSTRASGGI